MVDGHSLIPKSWVWVDDQLVSWRASKPGSSLEHFLKQRRGEITPFVYTFPVVMLHEVDHSGVTRRPSTFGILDVLSGRLVLEK